VAVRGLFALESDVDGFPSFAAKWAVVHGPALARELHSSRTTSTISPNAASLPGSMPPIPNARYADQIYRYNAL
jgi:hypothetical protein